MKRLLALAFGVALLAQASAAAHVVLAEPEADAGGYHAAFFRVGHGCGDSPTIALRVEIPAGVETARPQPKPGWTVEAERAGARVTALTWRGRLETDQFDQFGMLLRLPAAGEALTFAVTQTCETGSAEWSPVLRLRSSQAAPAPHAHH